MMRVVFTPRYMLPEDEPGRLTEPARDELVARAIIRHMEDRSRQDAPRPDAKFWRGLGYCLLLETLAAAFVMLMIYGHRLALWIDSWGAR